MQDLMAGGQSVLELLRPDTLVGALIYLCIFLLVAMLAARGLRLAVRTALSKQSHIDRTTISFLQQIGTALIWVLALIFYAQLIPQLRALGTALLAGASIASVVIGLAAQSTLGNLVAGIAITIYKPFRLGDTLQVAAPTGTEIGAIEMISLGYTTLRTPDGRHIVLPNSIAASQVTINLSETDLGTTPASLQLSIAIRIGRDADVESARKLALEVAARAVGKEAVTGCFLTQMDATSATLQLQLRAPDPAGRDKLRSKLLAQLAHEFTAAKLGGTGAEVPAFS
jgi:small-conductance mechanosensitive channel